LTSAARDLQGRTVLLVEDESLVSLLSEEVLTEAGYEVLLAMRLAEGLQIAAREPLDLAILDVNLGGGDTSYPIASTLRRRGIPFAFTTGYEKARLEPEYRNEAALQKPYEPSALVRLAATLARNT
jgi:DNA-binding response OmpR family regulator